MTDDIDSSFVCCILPTAFVTVLSWVERKWFVSVIHPTSDLKQYSINMGKSLAPLLSQGSAPGFLGPVPSLQVLCAKAVLPGVNFSDVVQAVRHFAACGLNDARAAAKELRAAHSISRVHCFCAVARVQAHFQLLPVVPPWFPEIVGLQSTAQSAAAAGCDRETPLKDWQRRQDIGKLRIAVHLLKHTRPGTDFGPLVTLLQDCHAPGFQSVFGSGRKHAQQLMNHVVSRELIVHHSNGIVGQANVGVDNRRGLSSAYPQSHRSVQHICGGD